MGFRKFWLTGFFGTVRTPREHDEKMAARTRRSARRRDLDARRFETHFGGGSLGIEAMRAMKNQGVGSYAWKQRSPSGLGRRNGWRNGRWRIRHCRSFV